LVFLEKHTQKQGREVIMSSSQANEKAPQIWHKKVGFVRAGKIENFLSVQQVPEIIFIKQIKKNSK